MKARACLWLIGGLAGVLISCARDTTITSPAVPDPALSVSAAARLTPSSTTTLSVNGCDFTVTYTWSGLKGRNLIASFGLYERSGGLDISFDLANVEGQLGKSGSLSHTFNLTAGAHGGRTVVARGSLVNSRNFAQIAGSSSASGTTLFSTCG